MSYLLLVLKRIDFTTGQISVGLVFFLTFFPVEMADLRVCLCFYAPFRWWFSRTRQPLHPLRPPLLRDAAARKQQVLEQRWEDQQMQLLSLREANDGSDRTATGLGRFGGRVFGGSLGGCWGPGGPQNGGCSVVE